MGEHAVVAKLHTDNREALKKIILMGFLPGAEVRLVRKFPAYVVESGHARFAMDRELASFIYVVRRTA